METLLTECVQNSLGHFMYHNAIFMCERLCAEFPSEVLHTFFLFLSVSIFFFLFPLYQCSYTYVLFSLWFIVVLGFVLGNAVIRFHFLGYLLFCFLLPLVELACVCFSFLNLFGWLNFDSRMCLATRV